MLKLPMLCRFNAKYAIKQFLDTFNANMPTLECGRLLGIRYANDKDSDFINDILEKTMGSYVNDTWPNNTNRVSDYFIQNSAQLAPDTTYIIFLTDTDESSLPIGRLSLSIDHQNLFGSFIHIENIHISPEYQGKSAGRLIITFINNYFAQVLSLTGTSLKVLDKNSEAQKLYEKIGFDSVRLSDIDCWNTENRDVMLWKPTYIYQPERAFYLNKFNSILDKIRDNTIIFSIFFLFFYSIQHIVGRALDFSNNNSRVSLNCGNMECNALNFHTLEFTHSITAFSIIFVLAIAFTFYDIVAGILYVQFRPSERLSGTNSWNMDASPIIWKVLLLVFLEFTMISVNIVIVMMPFFFLQTDFRIDGFLMFALFSIWHFTNLAWYFTSPVLLRECGLTDGKNERAAQKVRNPATDQIRLRDFARHGLYAAVNLIAFVVFYLLSPSVEMDGGSTNDKIVQEVFTIVLIFAYVVLLYNNQVARYFRNDFQRISRKRGKVRREAMSPKEAEVD